MLCIQRGQSENAPSRAQSNAVMASAETLAGWYVAYTKPRQEHIAEANLKQQDFQTYLPLFKTFKQSAATTTYEPMFPRYLFFKPSSSKQSVSAARSTRGINNLISFGAELALMAPEVLKTIQALEDQRNRADLQVISPFQPGRRARMRNTALNGLEGLVQSVSAKRVVVLLEILGRQKTINVEHDQLELV